MSDFAYYKILHWQDVAPLNLPLFLRQQRKKGIPSIIKFFNDAWTPLDRQTQLFWFELFKQQFVNRVPLSDKKFLEKARAAWSDLTRGDKAFTNFSGTDTYANYVTGERLNRGLPKQEGCTCTGNIVMGDVAPVTMKGQTLIKIYTLQWGVRYDPEIVNRKLTPWWVHTATTEYAPKDLLGRYITLDTATGKLTTWPKGKFRIDPFPHCGGSHTIGDVPVPIFTKAGFDYLPLANLVRIDGPSAAGSPYVP
jgi:hypothetical protein